MADFALTPPEPNRFLTFKDLIFRGWKWRYAEEIADNELPKEPGWDAKDARNLKDLLKRHPSLTPAQFGRWLLNYFTSQDHPSGEQPYVFLPKLLSGRYAVKAQSVYGRDYDAETTRAGRNRSAIDKARENLGVAGGLSANLQGRRNLGRGTREMGEGFRRLPGGSD